MVLTGPAPPPAEKAERVRTMFAGIAPRYDLMNALMTGGRDQAWRRTAVRLAAPRAGERVLDLATGTADLALAFVEASPAGRVVGADFVEGMLRHAREKLRHRQESRITLVAADALALPFPDASFGCVASAFLPSPRRSSCGTSPTWPRAWPRCGG
jgi:demethylmenaquinone methyltransferase/2-methoxy-6-polyprenyl-1,4-benzoquinol methylase